MLVLVALNDFPWGYCSWGVLQRGVCMLLMQIWAVIGSYLMAVAMPQKINFTSNPGRVFLHGLRSSNTAFSSGLGLLVKQHVSVVLELKLVSYGKENLLQPQTKCFYSCPCFEMGVNCWKCGRLRCYYLLVSNGSSFFPAKRKV